MIRCLNSTRFAEEQRTELFKQLQNYLDASDQGVSFETYVEMAENYGREINWEEAPPRLEDMDSIVIDAFTVYGLLADNIGDMSGAYFGKIYTGITEIMELLRIEPGHRELVLSIVTWLDRRTTKKMAEKRKREEAKAKQKSGRK